MNINKHISEIGYVTANRKQLKIITRLVDDCWIETQVVLNSSILSVNRTPLLEDIGELKYVYIPEGTFEFINPGYPITTK
jgi:hypothetical protein